MKNLLVDVPIDRAGLKRLQALPDVNVCCIEPADEARKLPSELLRDKHVLFCESPPLNLDDLGRLEWVQLSTVGYSHLYGLGLPACGIRACNARGVVETSIAEWNLAMMVNLTRDVRGMIRNQEQGVWERTARAQRELRGSVVGLWGYGGIGRDTARVSKALGLTVHVLSRHPVGPRHDIYSVPGTGDPAGVLPDRVFLPGQEREFLGGLDFLVIAAPLTSRTRGIIGRTELQSLKRTAWLLNPARGAIVDESALLTALREGWIAGAALDTHHSFPVPADHPFWRFPNVIMTPHISGSQGGQNFLPRIWDLFVQNIQRNLAEQPLLNELTAAELNDEC